MKWRLPFILSLLTAASLSAQSQSPAPWPEQRSAEVLEKVQTIRLDPDLTRLNAAERAALKDLLEVGRIFQDLYEDSLHHQARAARAQLERLHQQSPSRRTQNLLDLYRLWHGPITTTLDNQRLPILAVDREVPGHNLYPLDAGKEEIEAFLAAHPEERGEILADGLWSVVPVRRICREIWPRSSAIPRWLCSILRWSRSCVA